METTSDNGSHLGDATKRIAQRAFVIVENRLQLLMVEAQEERERVLLAILLALGAATFGLLAGVTLTVVIAVALWEHSPIIALLVLAALTPLLPWFFMDGSSVCNATGRRFREPWNN